MDLPESIPLETAMEMSLDDYIAAKKHLKVESDNYLSFETTPTYRDNRLTPVSNQWRFMQDNGSERPLGMPPLVSIESGLNDLPTTMSRPTPVAQRAGTSTAKDIEIQFENSECSPKSKNWRKRNNRRSNRQQDHLRGVNNSQANNMKNRVSVHERLYHMGNKGKQLQNSNQLRLPVFSNQNNIGQSLVSMANSNQRSMNQNGGNFLNEEFIKNCLELVQLFQKTPKLEPPEIKYDKKLQEEICEIQGKPLMYTGQDFTVVSFDGPGVNLQQHKPHTTEISLNQRFA